ncbi:MAG: DUF3466 family protein [Ketobacter sp.]
MNCSLKSINSNSRRLLAAILLVLYSFPTFSAQQYQIFNLTEAFGSGHFVPTDINDAGDVSGVYIDGNNRFESRGYLYKDGQLLELESEESIFTEQETLQVKTVPVAINNGGQVFGGVSYRYENQFYSVASGLQFLWENGLRYRTGYGDYVQSNSDCYPIDINDHGNYLLTCDAADNVNRTIYVGGNTYIDIYVRGTDIFATAINNDNKVVGRYLGAAFLLQNEEINLLPNLTQSRSIANDINNQGQIVGAVYKQLSGSEQYAFISSPGGHVTALTFEGNAYAEAINERGQVVGQLQDASSATEAFLFTDGSVQKLNDLVTDNPTAMTLTHATAINASGQIIGKGTVGGADFYYLATPVSNACPGEYRKYNLSGHNAQWQRFIADIPSCATHMNVEITGGTGDRDLYLRHTNPPWKPLFDCKRRAAIPNSDNHKRCQISNPEPGIWHIGVLRNSNYDGTTLRVRYW